LAKISGGKFGSVEKRFEENVELGRGKRYRDSRDWIHERCLT
jgi:hypothetical protein